MEEVRVPELPRAPRASGGSGPSTADAEAQADLRAGQWRPNFSLARAAQLVAGRMLLAPDSPPEEIGRQVAQLHAIPATDFVSRDLIEAIAVGIAQFERDSASLLLTQVWQYAALDATGIRALQHMAVEFSRWLRRPRWGHQGPGPTDDPDRYGLPGPQ